MLAQLGPREIAHPGTGVRFRNILVATDFSECSENALHQALGIARRFGSHIHIVHAVHAGGYYLGGPGVMAAAVDQAWRDAACLERKLLMAGAFAGLRHEIRVTGGPPADVLPEIMAEKGIDLLVMGTHGRSGLSKFFLGSCAEMMLRMAPCPVLTVGPNVTLPDNPESPFHHILLATDLSAAAERAARYALALAGEAKALLTVLHVLEAVPQEVCDRAVVVKSVKTRLQQWLELAGGSAQETRILAEFGALTETILGVAERGVSDLIVMGTHAPGVADEFLKWQNAYKIVCESSCPVLTVRALKD